MSDFWRRWHISLSTWFRDYVYIPLGGGRVVLPRWSLNILVTFALSGLWHGAAWTYVVWGLLHAAAVVAERMSLPLRARLGGTHGVAARACGMLATFIFVHVGWVFFRAQSVADAWYILRTLPSGWAEAADTLAALGHDATTWAVALAGIALVYGVDVWEGRRDARGGGVAQWPMAARVALYSAALWTLFVFGVLRQQEFIYFVF